jgi:hypothetical protein
MAVRGQTSATVAINDEDHRDYLALLFASYWRTIHLVERSRKLIAESRQVLSTAEEVLAGGGEIGKAERPSPTDRRRRHAPASRRETGQRIAYLTLARNNA